MRANGEQLREIAVLVDAGVITPVVDQVFPFQSTNEAMRHVESGRAKGKVVVTMDCAEDSDRELHSMSKDAGWSRHPAEGPVH